MLYDVSLCCLLYTPIMEKKKHDDEIYYLFVFLFSFDPPRTAEGVSLGLSSVGV